MLGLFVASLRAKEKVVVKAVLAAVMWIAFFGGPLQAATASKEVAKKTEKTIYIYLASQAMRCYLGDEVVLSTRISSGKGWQAPGSKKGNSYRANYTVLAKDPRKGEATSKLIDDDGNEVIAKTPWKLILSREYGHYVRIHGYRTVPRKPASHGCFRVPLKQAQDVFEFADVGTRVVVEAGKVPKATKHRHRSHTRARRKARPKLYSNTII